MIRPSVYPSVILLRYNLSVIYSLYEQDINCVQHAISRNAAVTG